MDDKIDAPDNAPLLDKDGRPLSADQALPDAADAQPLPDSPKTEDQLLGFEQINEQLALLEHSDVLDLEDKKTREAIRDGISKPRNTFDNKHFAFISIDVHKKGLESLFECLQHYPHVRELDLSDNRLADIATICHLPHLCVLKAAKNAVASIDFFADDSKLQFLHSADLSSNRLERLPPLAVKRLRKLDLKNNKIASCSQLRGHDRLETLELRGNRLESLDGIRDMPLLVDLFAAQNQLKDISGLANLPSLQRLHLRDNKPLEAVSPLGELPKLRYLNLRDSGFKDLPSLGRIAHIKSLEKVSLVGTPAEAENSDLKTETLMILNHIKLFAKETEEITAEERLAALEALQKRRQEEEEKRLQQEAEDRQLREEQQRKAAEGGQPDGDAGTDL